MALDLNQSYDQIKSKVKSVKAYKDLKKQYDNAKKRAGDSFEKKKSKEKDSDLYKTTQYADTRRAIDAARKEYPGATDIEALAAHGYKQDQLNQKQQREIDQLRRDEKQIVQDLKDKEKRFQDYTALVARSRGE